MSLNATGLSVFDVVTLGLLEREFLTFKYSKIFLSYRISTTSTPIQIWLSPFCDSEFWLQCPNLNWICFQFIPIPIPDLTPALHIFPPTWNTTHQYVIRELGDCTSSQIRICSTKKIGIRLISLAPEKRGSIVKIIIFKHIIQITQIAKFMGATWGLPGSCRPQMGPMLAPLTLLSGVSWTLTVKLRSVNATDPH